MLSVQHRLQALAHALDTPAAPVQFGNLLGVDRIGYRMQVVIPLRSMKSKPKPGLTKLFDRSKNRQRNVIERMCGLPKENRRIVERFDKFARSYGAMVSMSCAMWCLRR